MNVGRDGVVYYRRRPEGADWNEHDAAVNVLKSGFLEFFQTEFREEDIQKREHGKPYYGANPNLKFNISHCRGGVSVVISEREVGIDMESMRKVTGRIVEKCCNREEMDYVFGKWTKGQKNIPAGNPSMLKKQEGREENDILQDGEVKRFLTLWTLKESYVKMTGEGLRTSFDRVCFFPWDLQKMKEKEVKEIQGFDSLCRHYVCSFEGFTLALTVQWGEEREPDFVWKEL